MISDNFGMFLLAVALVIIVFEIYIPFMKRLFVSLCVSCLVSAAFSDCFSDMIYVCIVFSSTLIAVYATLVILNCFKTKRKQNDYFDVISLTDIESEGFGVFFCGHKTEIIKNTFGRNIRKGEVLRIRIGKGKT